MSHLGSVAHGFVWMMSLPFREPYLHPFLCRRLWPLEAEGLSQEGPSGPAEGTVVEGRADQSALLFEEAPVGAPEKLSGVGIRRAEYELEFGLGEIRRAAVLEGQSVQRLALVRRVGYVSRMLHRARPAVLHAHFEGPLRKVPVGGLFARQRRVDGD